jgi:hypothetical protein
VRREAPFYDTPPAEIAAAFRDLGAV